VAELWEVLTDHFSEFATGFGVTVRLVAISFVVAMVMGTVVAALRVAPVKPLNWVGGVFVEVFRNTPLLVLLFISFAGLRRAGIPVDAWVAGTASLGLYTAAYVAEALRSGVFAVSKGQIEASLSLGLDYPRTMRYIILPQAFRTRTRPSSGRRSAT
jgi:putative glutamine transport system permease protein